MSPLLHSILMFIAGLVLTLISSLILARTLEKICARYRLSEGLMGAIVAFGANMPELSSAIIAIFKGKNELGVGVILGSNIFNLAAILGISTLISGRISVGRKMVLVGGGASVAMTLGVLFLILGAISPLVALIGMTAIFIWYLFKANSVRHDDEVPQDSISSPSSPISGLAMLVALPAAVAVIFGSFWMIGAIEVVGKILDITHLVLGSLILAGVTGLPNVSAAIALARRGKGSAVVNEAFSSNNLNLLLGYALPAVLIGFAEPGAPLRLEAWIFAGLTLFSAIALFVGRGLNRWGATALIAGYFFFVFMTLR